MAMKEAELRSVAAFTSAEQAVKEYQSQPHTPELVTKVFQTIWQARGELVGMVFEVSPCPYTQKELTGLEKKGRRVGYLPTELATQQNRHILGEMFPETGGYSGNLVTNDKDSFGWFDYETEIDAPYFNTTEKQLTERVARDGRKLLNLNQYIVAAQDNKLLTGQYLDEERTRVRLGSRYEGRVVDAHFFQDGYLDVYWHPTDYYLRGLGGRSSGVKKA